MALMDFPGIDSDLAVVIEKEIMSELSHLEKQLLEAHQEIRDFKTASGYSIEVAVDNPEIDRYSKAHLARLKRILSPIKDRIKDAAIYGDAKARLGGIADDLEFKIDIVGLSVM